MAHKLSLGYLTLPGVSPPELVRIAAAAGCGGVSISAALSAMMTSQASLLEDAGLRAETARALKETGITIDLVEGVSVAPETDLTRARAAIELMRELGAPRFNISVWETDRSRASDLMAGFCEMAVDLEMGVTLEFLRLSQVRSLREAATLVNSGQYPGLQILVDALHLARGGETPADVAALDPQSIGFAQLCDAPALSPDDEGYMYEAMNERLAPGDGELPLAALLKALPQDLVVALETPMRGRAEAGVSPLERVRLAADAARRLAIWR